MPRRKLRSASAVLFFWALSACAPASASPSVPATDANAPVGSGSVGFALEQFGVLSACLQKLVDDQEVAGMVTMLARHGELVQRGTFGYQDLDERIPMESDTIFWIYSMTNPVAGVAMMILHEEGLWDLDGPVSRHVPEFEGLQVGVEDDDGEVRLVELDHPMTMRELMTHTGDPTNGLFSQSLVDTMCLRANVLDTNSSLQAMIGKLSDIPLWQQSGSLWHYSVSFDVQGYIVEKLSGQTLPEFFEEHIFRPLGLEDTGFGLNVAVTDDPAASGSPVGRGSYWWDGAAGTWFWIDPANDLVFVGMAQHDFLDIAHFVPLTQELTYQALVDPEL